MVNIAMRPMANSIGVVNRSLPPHIVASQLKIFTPVGTAMNIVDSENAATDDRAEAGGEHVVGPHAPAHEADGDAREHHERVAEERLAGEHREDLGHDARMPGRIRMYTSGWPKIQNRCCHSSGSAPAATLKKLAPKCRSNMSRNSATVMTGMANSSRNCVTSVIQVNTGMLHQRHARRPHVEHGDDEVDGADERRDAGDHAGRWSRSRCRGSGENVTPVFGA